MPPMPPMPRHSRPMPRHHAQESSDRAALLSPPDLAPTSADGVFVPHNGVITFNLNRLSVKKKTEALQYQRALFRTSCLKKAVIRENLTGQPAFLTTRRSKHAIRAPGLRCVCLPCSTYGSSTPARVKRLAPFSSARLTPSPDGPLTHFASPLGEKCRLMNFRDCSDSNAVTD